MTATVPAKLSPRGAARRRAFLAAATEVFLRKGYAEATLDEIIALSGGSRQTLYAMFGGKQGLFEAILAERCEAILAPLAAEAALAQPPEEALVGLGVRLLGMLASGSAALVRTVVAEAVRAPEIARLFWRLGPGRNRELVARYLAHQAAAGVLVLDDPEKAAARFIGMVLGLAHLRALLDLEPRPEPAEIEADVRAAVAHFLDGCRGPAAR